MPRYHNSYGDEISPALAYLRDKGLYLILAVAAIVVIFYFVHQGVQSFSVSVSTAPATLSTVAISCETESYIFREEIVLRAQAGRSSIPAVVNGSHVATGTTVARMYDESTPDVMAQLEVLEKQLETLNAMKDKSVSTRDIVSIDTAIYDTMLSLSVAGRGGDASAVNSLKGSLISELNRRSVLIGAFSNVDNAVKELTAQRERILNSLGVCRQTVYAQKSGYYYSEADGCEDAFSADVALTMSTSEFRALTEYTAQDTTATAGKIAPSYLWYTACFIPSENAQYMTVGRSYSLTFPANNNIALTCKLVRFENCADGENSMAVFSCGTLPEDFLFTRCQRVLITCKEYTGYRVPFTALHVENGVQAVYILSGSQVRLRYVKELYRGEDFMLLEPFTPSEDDAPPAFVTVENVDGSTDEIKDYFDPNNWLKRNNIIITSGKKLYDGKILTAN